MSRQAAERGAKVAAWLAAGGIVLAATERARRSLVSAYGAAQRNQGLLAWQTPAIFSWELWVREQWLARNQDGLARNQDGLVLLNAVQEQALWSKAIRSSGTDHASLQTPQTQTPFMQAPFMQTDRLASAAIRAHRLLADYAPNALRSSARTGWSDEAAIFSGWLSEFEAGCRREGLIASCRLALHLATTLRAENGSQHNAIQRPKLLLIGFDRLVETQKDLLSAWGESELFEWAPLEWTPPETSSSFWIARDAAAELSACVAWLRAQRQANPKAQLLVVTTGLERRRGELERALLRSSSANAANKLDFEFSLGVPLAGVGIVRSALLLLRWLAEPISEAELDWLLSSGYSATGSDEELELAATMLALRHKGWERPEWPLDAFLASPGKSSTGKASTGKASTGKSSTWAARMAAAQQLLRLAPVRQSPLEWVRLTGQLLEATGWPGFRPLGSTAFQAQRSFSTAIEVCGSLGFDGSLMDWLAFLHALQTATASAIFATESTDAAVLITEPLESAGLLADGIWFLGTDEQSWPGRGQPHPFLPSGLQRDAAMPHSSNQADWQLAQQATQRLIDSAENIVFSFARHTGETEARPSRLVVQALGMPHEMPSATHPKEDNPSPLTEWFEDTSQPAFPNDRMAGGSSTLSRQSNCPFQAFATARLETQHSEPAEAGLSARQRGQLLHGVLVRIWGGDAIGEGPMPGAIRTHAELTAIPDLPAFVRGFVDRTMDESFLPGRHNSLPDRFPPRLLALEADRLTRLAAEWLAYEQQRLPFSVDGTELDKSIAVAGLTVNLRLDRIDSVPGGKLIVDYKTGSDGPKAWDGDRPENVQLPLYATHAVPEEVEGLVFARLKAGDVGFYGRARDARSSLLAGLGGKSSLVKTPLTGDQLEDWRLRIEQLGQDFVAGRAEVDPKDGLETCKHCHLHAVCRVYENLSASELTPQGDEEESTVSEGEANV
jgi:ATP-dependent helicase/nuclease subunit B